MAFAGSNGLLPSGLKTLLSDQYTPWSLNNRLFKRVQEAPYENNSQQYKQCRLWDEDREVRFVQKYFDHSKPANYVISNLFCIHNPTQTATFEASIDLMETEAKNGTFRPQWQTEGHTLERTQVIERWKKQANEFSPIEIQKPSRKDTYHQVRVLPLVHGTSQGRFTSIAASGFAIFGKHEGKGPHCTDEGFFGSGIYFTNSAQYASMYSADCLVLTWVAMREPFPVINDVPLPGEGSDMQKLKGKGGAYQNYTAHYIPVAFAKRPNQYYPCYQNQEPAWDEYVVFNPAHTLPRFCIELGIGLPKLVLPSYPKIEMGPNYLCSEKGVGYGERQPVMGRTRVYFIGTCCGGVAGLLLFPLLELRQGVEFRPFSRDYWGGGLSWRLMYAIVGALLGAYLGFLRASHILQQRALDYKKVNKHLVKEQDKVIQIVNAFILRKLEKEAVQIFCPLAQTPLLFPVTMKCGHVFEYYSIIQWISADGHCPVCPGKVSVNIVDVQFDRTLDKKVVGNIRKVFFQFEALLERLLKGHNDLPNFSDDQHIAYLVEKLREGSPLLRDSVEIIVQKIENDTLSEGEIYVIGNHFVHQIKQTKEKIGKLYCKSCEFITNLEVKHQNEEPVMAALKDHHDELRRRLQRTRAIIPPACRILQNLYKA